MEHLRRIIQRIDIIHGLPGIIGTSCLTHYYRRFMKNRVEKYAKICILIEKFINPTIEKKKYSVLTREHLPAEIIGAFSFLLPQFWDVCMRKHRGLYIYALEGHSHISAIKAEFSKIALSEFWFTRCLWGIHAYANYMVNLSASSPRDKSWYFHQLCKLRKYKMIDKYAIPEMQRVILPVIAIPLKYIEEFAKSDEKLFPGVAQPLAEFVELYRFLERVNSAINGNNFVYREECKIPHLGSILQLPDFAYSGGSYGDNDRYRSKSRIWRLEWNNLDQICALKTPFLLKTGNFGVVLQKILASNCEIDIALRRIWFEI